MGRRGQPYRRRGQAPPPPQIASSSTSNVGPSTTTSWRRYTIGTVLLGGTIVAWTILSHLTNSRDAPSPGGTPAQEVPTENVSLHFREASSLLSSACPLASSPHRYSFLPADAMVHECVARSESHGGLLVVPNFLRDDELSLFTRLLDHQLPAQQVTPHQYAAKDVVVTLDGCFGDRVLPVQDVALCRQVVQRLQRIPGLSPDRMSLLWGLSGANASAASAEASKQFKRAGVAEDTAAAFFGARGGGAGGGERLQLTRTGNKSILNAHHDLFPLANRYVTVLVYLGKQRTSGGHTLFPLHALSGHAPAQRDGERARESIARRITERADPPIRRGQVAYLPPFRDTSGEMRTLCEAARQADETAGTPPCLAVPPLPGAAAIFWHWGRREIDGEARAVPEMSNFHVACPAHGPMKMAMQSFREWPAAVLPPELTWPSVKERTMSITGRGLLAPLVEKLMPVTAWPWLLQLSTDV